MIRKATFDDGMAVAKLALEMWQNHKIDELTQEFEKIIDSDDGAVFLAVVNNDPVGFAQCQLRRDYVEGTSSSPVGYLEGIYVREDYRNKGYAKKLLCECEQWASSKGCFEFASDCEIGNDVSFNFHLKSGFIEANRIICFIKQI